MNELCESKVCVGDVCLNGPQETGSACDEDSDCAEGALCVAEICQDNPGGVGAKCEENQDCGSGLFCRLFFEGPELAASSACCETAAIGWCREQTVGAGCANNQVCSSSVCVENTCRAAARDVGQSCDANDNGDCDNQACGRDVYPDVTRKAVLKESFVVGPAILRAILFAARLQP